MKEEEEEEESADDLPATKVLRQCLFTVPVVVCKGRSPSADSATTKRFLRKSRPQANTEHRVDQRAASTKKKQLKLKEMGRPQIAQIHICEGGRRKGQEGRSIQ